MLAMPSAGNGIQTKWTLLCAVILVSFWVWRQPFRSALPPASGFIPKKLYEPEAVKWNDNLASEFQGAPKDPKAPSIPAFKESAESLPSDVYNPYPEYNSREWKKRWRDQSIDIVSHAAPEPVIGSYKETGLHSDFCFDRHSRYDPYGYDEGDFSGAQDKASRASKVIWDNVNWGELQKECFLRNEGRYKPYNRTDASTTFRMPTKEDHDEVDRTLILASEASKEGTSYWQWQAKRKGYKKKNAVVLRTWDGNEWTVDTMQFVRSYIMELALHSGAEYEVIILVEVKDLKKKIFDDPKAYREALITSVPDEFVDMTLLFNRKLLEMWYPKVGKHDAQTSQTSHMHMPMELLSLLRPDIDFFWQMELDLRYTGHHYHHLETISAWSEVQPRKLQWERASRYYVPAAHGSWADFSETIANATKGGGIWGAQRTTGIEPVGAEPPVSSPEQDNYEWGVGADADFINLSTVFDVSDTEKSGFIFRKTKDRFPDGDKTPARATATTPMIRMSKRLLRAMHHSQVTLGVHMFPEMYAESTALQHGLKMVVFPLPVYMDFARSPEWIAKTFNANEGSTLLDSPYKYKPEWRRMTYWHSMDQITLYPDELYKRWLGYVSAAQTFRNSLEEY
ncbi:hypothetical protein P7C71_g2946, partial [Lecanoromycetidae sp. Uapishka_2]